MARKKIKLAQSLDDLMLAYFPKPTKEQKAKDREDNETLTLKAGQEKASIKLRGKKASHSITLYLDQYKDGKRVYEFLPKDFSLNIEQTEQDRENNVGKMAAANKILVERRDALLLKGIGIIKANKGKKKNLIEYIKEIADKQLKATGKKHSYYYILNALAKHIETYSGADTTIKEVDIDYCKGFIAYLKNDALNGNYKKSDDEEKNKDVKLSQNHQHHLFVKLDYILGCAVNDKYLQFNPCKNIQHKDKIQAEAGTREYLTINEVKALYKTECKHPQVKQAFLFCCLVGLRFSDLVRLQWSNFYKDIDGDTNLTIKMQKLSHLSAKVSTLDVLVSDEALKWLPTRENANDDDLVFELSDNEQTNVWLKKWVKEAGITKKITFHCSRHTAATLNLSLGVPKEKVQKLLGHSKISTTEIYAELLKENLKGEMNKQNGIFD